MTGNLNPFALLIFLSLQLSTVKAQSGNSEADNGMKGRSFLYVGEWDTRHPEAQKMFKVVDGKVVWEYSIPFHPALGANQEFDDVTMLPNGNIVFARMSGAGIVTSDKKLIWEFVCPPGSETHSCVPIGKDSVLMVLNASPGKVLIINTATNKILKEIQIRTTTTSTHGQFRHVRMTKNGSIVVPLLSEGRVVEYKLDGNEIWSVNALSDGQRCVWTMALHLFPAMATAIRGN